MYVCMYVCMYLFMAALGLRTCAGAFSSCGEWGLFFLAVCGLLIAVASLAAEHGLQARGLQQLQHAGSVVAALGLQSLWASVVVAHGLSRCSSWALQHRLSSCGAQAQLLRGLWDLPGPGIQPVSPALAGGFLTTGPPGKSLQYILAAYIFSTQQLVPLTPLPLSYPLFPLRTGTHWFVVYESVSVSLYLFICFIFLDSTYKG